MAADQAGLKCGRHRREKGQEGLSLRASSIPMEPKGALCVQHPAFSERIHEKNTTKAQRVIALSRVIAPKLWSIQGSGLPDKGRTARARPLSDTTGAYRIRHARLASHYQEMSRSELQLTDYDCNSGLLLHFIPSRSHYCSHHCCGYNGRCQLATKSSPFFFSFY